jgi:hypothetical protein
MNHKYLNSSNSQFYRNFADIFIINSSGSGLAKSICFSEKIESGSVSNFMTYLLGLWGERPFLSWPFGAMHFPRYYK